LPTPAASIAAIRDSTVLGTFLRPVRTFAEQRCGWIPPIRRRDDVRVNVDGVHSLLIVAIRSQALGLELGIEPRIDAAGVALEDGL
jgi:hypothetical protein